MSGNGLCKDSCVIKQLTLQKWNEPEENPQGFPSRLVPGNYFYTLSCVGFLVRITIVLATKSPILLFFLFIAAIIIPIRKNVIKKSEKKPPKSTTKSN